MKSALRPGIALAALGLFACSGTGERDPHDTSAPFISAFEVLETRHGSGHTAAPESRLVDYESGLTVRPDRATLARLIGTVDGTDPTLHRGELAALDARIRIAEEHLQDLEYLRAVVDGIAEYEVASVAYFATLEKGVVPGADPGYLRVVEMRREVIEALDHLAQIHVETVVLGRAIDWNPPFDWAPTEAEMRAQLEANAAHDLVYDTMAPASQGRRNRYVASEVTRVLNRTADFLRGQIVELERAVLAKAPKADLEMEAKLVRAGQPYPISISPYTIVEGVDRGSKTPRIGIPSEEDVQRVQRGYEAYDDLADSLNNLKELARDDEALRELARTLRKELEAAGRRLAEGLLEDLRGVGQLSGDEFAELKRAAAALQTELMELKREVETIAETSDPVLLLGRCSALLERLRSGTLVAAVKAVEESLLAFTGEVLANLDEAARTLVERLEGSVAEEADRLVEALRDEPGGQDLALLYRSIRTLRELADADSWGDLETGKITRKAFSLEIAQDGYVDLADSPAEQGDRLAVHFKVVVNPEAEEADRREHRGSAWFDVRKFGVYTTLRSQLIFYNRLHDGSSSYRAAPALAYNVHGRPDGHYWFWDSVNPGLGISVSAPSYENSVDLAIGLQLTLFNDMLQAGYGYNISVSEGQEMFYFGLDLIGAFQAMQ